MHEEITLLYMTKIKKTSMYSRPDVTHGALYMGMKIIMSSSSLYFFSQCNVVTTVNKYFHKKQGISVVITRLFIWNESDQLEEKH